MAELIFFLGLAGPVILMIWLTVARRKAQAKVEEMEGPDDHGHGFDMVEEGEAGPDGLIPGRQHLGDGTMDEPDSTGGETDGIRAMQGRR